MIKRTISMTLILLLLVIISACSSTPKALSGEEIFSKISPSTVEIHAECDYISSLGTGFFIDEDGTVVTNYHVIQNCSSGYITASDGNTYDIVNISGYSKELDIAILSTTKTNSTPVEINTEVVTGETVYVLGSSLGLTGTFSEGLVSTSARDIDGIPYIQISAPISHGNSGGPVVNKLGQVIGIACAGFDEGQNLNLALPISILEQVSTEKPLTMKQFFQKTSIYYGFDDRVIYDGSMLALRTITLDESFMQSYYSRYTFELAMLRWEENGATEASMIKLMDSFGKEQGGGALRIIDPGMYVEEVDKWLFDPSRQPGDYALIENIYGCTLCYISILQPE